MSGQVIPFRGPGEARRAALYREPIGKATLEQQFERIADLLAELESLTGTARHVPASILRKARTTMDRARRLIAAASTKAGEAGDADEGSEPQPEVDREMLERMYRDANPHKLKPTP